MSLTVEKADPTGDASNSAMFRISELAKTNNLHPVYKLVNELGPAHQKVFTVALHLSDSEEYTASGPSIKKAQQAAALLALEQTKLQLQSRSIVPQSKNAITPAVRLNSLALKLGLTPSYEFHNSPLVCPFENDYLMYPVKGPPFDLRFPLPTSRMFSATLSVSGRQFFGSGPSIQAAKQDAAQQGLEFLTSSYQATNAQKFSGRKIRRKVVEPQSNGSAENVDLLGVKDEMKSPVSLVHETALLKKLAVSFEVISEDGPNHQRNFLLSCTLRNEDGNVAFVSEGQGPSKKHARVHACERVLELMKESGPLPLPGQSKRSAAARKQRKSKVIKKCIDPTYGDQLNPISRLIQIQQAKGEPEPKFEFIRETGVGRSQEFMVQVQVGDKVCQGVGPNKKLAKRAAAEVLLDELGLNKVLPSPGKPVLKPSVSVDQDPVSSVDSTDTGSNCNLQTQPDSEPTKQTDTAPLNGRKVQFADGTDGSFNGDGFKSKSSRFARAHQVQFPSEILLLSPKSQLEYLASSVGFDVQYTNFPKNDKRFGGCEEQSFLNSEYLSIVSLGRKLSQVSHGCGPSEEAAQNAAATAAMSSLGLGVKSKVATTEIESSSS